MSLRIAFAVGAFMFTAGRPAPPHRSPVAPYTKLAVFAWEDPNSPRRSVAREVCSHLAAGSCVEGESVTPPTRAYTPQEFSAALAAAGVDAVLVIGLFDDTHPQYFGRPGTPTKANGSSSTLYDNVAYWCASWPDSLQPVRYEIVGSEGVRYAILGVFEQSTGALAWTRELRTNRDFVRPSNPDYVRNAGNQIASALKDAKIAR